MADKHPTLMTTDERVAHKARHLAVAIDRNAFLIVLALVVLVGLAVIFG